MTEKKKTAKKTKKTAAETTVPAGVVPLKSVTLDPPRAIRPFINAKRATFTPQQLRVLAPVLTKNALGLPVVRFHNGKGDHVDMPWSAVNTVQEA